MTLSTEWTNQKISRSRFVTVLHTAFGKLLPCSQLLLNSSRTSGACRKRDCECAFLSLFQISLFLQQPSKQDANSDIATHNPFLLVRKVIHCRLVFALLFLNDLQ